MSYKVIQPVQELSAHIRHFWHVVFPGPTFDNNKKYLKTANSTIEVAFAFNKKSLVYSSVQGHGNQFGCYDMNRVDEIIGISIYPHSAPCFFDLHSKDFLNCFITTDYLYGNQTFILEMLLEEQIGLNNKLLVFDHFLKNIIANNNKIDKRILSTDSLIRNHNGQLSIAELAEISCLSTKQYVRRFKECIGFNPKLFSRIVRFEKSLDIIYSHHSLTEVSYQLGYFDQAHFVREFSEFAGMSPGKFLTFKN